MPAVAQRHTVACFKGLSIRALDRDAARHPKRTGDGAIRGDFGRHGDLLGQIWLDILPILIDAICQHAPDGQRSTMAMTSEQIFVSFVAVTN